MDKKYVLLSLDDKRLKNIAEVLGNKTSGRIIDALAEVGEASEKDISEKMKIPINTVEYNLKKMIQAGILEESKSFFWSTKGKKIKMYKISKKSIIISPKSTRVSSEIKQILPIALVSGIAAASVKYFYATQNVAREIAQDSTVAFALEKTIETGNFISASEYYWIWFLSGAFFSIVLFIIFKIIINYTFER